MTTTTTHARPVYDVNGTPAPRGTPVHVDAAPRPTRPDETDPAFTGTVHTVEYRDGTAYTVCVWTDHGARWVYANRVHLN